MEISLADKTARIEGAATPVSISLRDRLAEDGAIIATEGVPDLLIISAPLLEVSDFDWDGLSETARTIGSAMQARGTGRMVFLLTGSATLPVRRQPDLSMRMAALHALMRALAMSLAPEVGVNALGTGAICTDAGVLISGDNAMIGHASVGRAGTVGEACNVALFLCDFENTYLTGQLLCADGGWAAGYGRSF
jgi:NAD(P)-dependent dehydrogenase (short-subunit alcohol dehydrogenase family)